MMVSPTRELFASAVLLPIVLSLAAGPSYASLLVYPPEFPVRQTSQEVVIFHDGERETLVLSPSFQGKAKDFAWIIPVPGKPKVEKVSDDLFLSLTALTGGGYAVPEPMGRGDFSRSPGSGQAPVELTERKNVDLYDLSVLEASNPKSLSEWLKSRGYPYPQDKEPLLRSYFEKKWHFVAVRVNPAEEGLAQEYLDSGRLSPLKISFDSKAVIYPLKISGPSVKKSLSGKIAAFSFEEGLEGWNPYVAGSSVGRAEVNNDFSFHARNSVKILDTDGRGDAYVYQRLSGMKGGKGYVFSAYVRAKEGSHGNANLLVQNGPRSKPLPLEKLTEWTRIILPFTATYESHEFDLIANGMESGGVLYFDAVQIEEGDNPSDFTGEIISGKTGDNQTFFNLTFYVLTKAAKTAPGFNTNYVKKLTAGKIENLSLSESGQPWIKPQGPMYLTVLTRSLRPVDISNDLVFRDDEKKRVFGQDWEVDGLKVVLVIMTPLLVEGLVIGYLFYRKVKTKKGARL